MTFREKLRQEWPNKVNTKFIGGCIGCPCDYGYEEEKMCANPRDMKDVNCTTCWDREMPETAEAEAQPERAEPEPAGNDPVSHPAHYTAGGIECIDAIEAAISCQREPELAFLTGQVIKYLWRFPLKNGLEDLKKAKWYLNRLIEEVEGL